MRQSETGWLVKWAVTHFSDLIYDTQQISVIRGGSEAAAAAAGEVADLARKYPGVEVIYAAASQALFHLRASQEEHARDLARALEEHTLRGDAPLAVPSVAAWTPAPGPGAGAGPLREAIRVCERQIEVGRTQRLGVHVGKATAADALDQFDQCRLAGAHTIPREGQSLPLSDWNWQRYQYGRRGHALLSRLDRRWKEGYEALGEEGRELSSDLHGLAQAGSSQNLIGLIYADGIGFTSVRERARNLPSLKALSEQMDAFMKAVLREALSEDLDALLKKKVRVMPVHRLLAAGDEFVLVCRSDRALPIALAIHQAAERHSKDLDLRDLLEGEPPIDRLTFAVGTVVAHVTTPIRLLRRLAHELEGSAKAKAKAKAHGRPYPSYTDFAVLRGLGITESSLRSLREDLSGIGSLRERHFEVPLAGDEGRLRLYGRPLTDAALRGLLEDAHLLRKHLSGADRHRLLRELAAALREATPPSHAQIQKRYEKARKRVAAEHPAIGEILERLQKRLDDHEPVLPLADLDEALEVVP